MAVAGSITWLPGLPRPDLGQSMGRRTAARGARKPAVWRTPEAECPPDGAPALIAALSALLAPQQSGYYWPPWYLNETFTFAR